MSLLGHIQAKPGRGGGRTVDKFPQAVWGE